MSVIRIVHRTGYAYAEPAITSYNEARMTPQSDEGQYVLRSSLRITPQATEHGYVDYWGTRVCAFEVLRPHRQLTLIAESVVEVRPARPAAPALGFGDLDARVARSLPLAECLGQTALTEPDAEVEALASRHRAAGGDVGAVASAICEEIRAGVEYVRGVTGVHSTAEEAWRARKGVCQDITHIALGALRSVGIPARYVSGYLHPEPDAPIGQTVRGESHAWVEWFSGSWQPFDPTNGRPVDGQHVAVGRGRDYTDVAPLRGVYAGPSGSDMFVEVEVTRLS